MNQIHEALARFADDDAIERVLKQCACLRRGRGRA
jgi:hypothetical protein